MTIELESVFFTLELEEQAGHSTQSQPKTNHSDLSQRKTEDNNSPPLGKLCKTEVMAIKIISCHAMLFCIFSYFYLRGKIINFHNLANRKE